MEKPAQNRGQTGRSLFFLRWSVNQEPVNVPSVPRFFQVF
jgi:hypothetical protein